MARFTLSQIETRLLAYRRVEPLVESVDSYVLNFLNIICKMKNAPYG